MTNENTLKQLTPGQELVGLDFNPAGNPTVHSVKLKCAEMLDLLLDLRNCKENSYAKNLLIGIALQAIITAQMYVVKVITYKN